eukprot:scaffold2179_cov165-Amphora_coffeaeformis.AAC.27
MLNKMWSGFVAEIRYRLHRGQEWLSFAGWSDCALFATKQGAGRAALLGAGLGGCLGFHACGFIGLTTWQLWTGDGSSIVSSASSNPRIFMAWQWCGWASSMSIFHLLEYFTTAVFNPTAASSDSFLVNQSASYTMAVVTQCIEFGIRFVFWPDWNLPRPVVLAGLVMTAVAQTIRSAAMITAGQSFNHIIQTYKKENHVLIEHGIYSVFRHPSYVGFYYWSVGTQLLLGNLVHAVAFSVVSCLCSQDLDGDPVSALTNHPEVVECQTGVKCLPRHRRISCRFSVRSDREKRGSTEGREQYFARVDAGEE